MNTGFIYGVLLAVINGAICLALPLILSRTMQKQSSQPDNADTLVAESESPESAYTELTFQ